MIRVSAEPLTGFCAALFSAAGTPNDVAETVAGSLVYADLRGVDSHGAQQFLAGLMSLSQDMKQHLQLASRLVAGLTARNRAARSKVS